MTGVLTAIAVRLSVGTDIWERLGFKVLDLDAFVLVAPAGAEEFRVHRSATDADPLRGGQVGEVDDWILEVVKPLGQYGRYQPELTEPEHGQLADGSGLRVSSLCLDPRGSGNRALGS